MIHRISHYLYSSRFYFTARLLSQLTRFLTGIEIHPGAQIGMNVVIDHGLGVVIGETAQVGDECIIYHGVTLGSNKLIFGKRHPTIGKRVIIGAGAKLLGSIIVEDDAKIGANAVVVKNIKKGSTNIGVPSKEVIRKNFDSSNNNGFDSYQQFLANNNEYTQQLIEESLMCSSL